MGLAGNIGKSLALQVATDQHDYYVIQKQHHQCAAAHQRAGLQQCVQGGVFQIGIGKRNGSSGVDVYKRQQVSIADLFAEEAPVPAAAAEARPAPEQEAAP